MTGEIHRLIGVYLKYGDAYPNNDVVQPITRVFQVAITSGQLDESDEETLGLNYFAEKDFSPVVNQQHEDFKKNVFSVNQEQTVVR